MGGLTFEQYSKDVEKTAIYPNIGNNYNYPLKGLFGEVGEIADKLKKIERDYGNIFPEHDNNNEKCCCKTCIVEEIGDSTWYLDRLAFELGSTLERAAEMNTEKLFSRFERGTISGSGDHR